MRRLIVAFGAAALVGCTRAGGPVVIGLAGPFSSARGASMQRAAQLAAREINAAGGIHGRQIELEFADDSGADSVAIRVAERLRDDPRIVAVIGHLSSGPTIAAVPVYSSGSHPVALISPSASSPDLTGVSPWFFRVCPSDLAHGPALARFARTRLGARRVGVIYVNSDYGRGIRTTFAREFRAEGGTVIDEDPYVPATPSLEPYLSRMREEGVDAVVLAAERPGAELALREMQTLGLHWPALGGDALVGIESDGALAEGLHISTAYLADRPGDRNAAFVTAYARAFGGDVPDHRGAGAYDIVHLVAQAVAAVGTDRARVRDWLAGVGTAHAAYDGVTGRIAFDAHGDVPAKDVVIGVVHGGRLVTEREP